MLLETHLRDLPACVMLLGSVLPETHLHDLLACVVLLGSMPPETHLCGQPACVVLLASMPPETHLHGQLACVMLLGSMPLKTHLRGQLACVSTSGPVRRLFFYDFPHPAAVFANLVLPKLKSSLSLALAQFYPLAGNLRCSVSHDDVSEVGWTGGESLSFVLAECDSGFHEFSGDYARDVYKLQRLAPRPIWSGAAKPLSAVQVTVFPDQSFTVGVWVHNVACDGSSFMRFVKSWASVCRAGEIVEPVPPLFDRTAIPYPLQLRSVNIIPGYESSWTREASTLASNLVTATFALGQDHIRRLKCWTLGDAGDETAHFTFTADARDRLRSPVPETYFGNCIVPCFVEVKVSDLVGEDGIFAASEAIGKAIEDLKHGALKGVHGMCERWYHVTQKLPMTLTGSPKFKAYDTDFGWGRPVKVETVLQKTRAMYLQDSRRGDGVEIGLSFEQHQMDAFERHFLGGLKLLPE
ncbi:anthocyanin 5-aromatic acyltransferase-like [Musa acuminata AAA Group]|uniref:anthocyanin 5-aromatic acyltransferase-like n=1 Tax=Musa acuminata AAA Group TaxID=214697 RepID=UPI0031CE8207